MNQINYFIQKINYLQTKLDRDTDNYTDGPGGQINYHFIKVIRRI